MESNPFEKNKDKDSGSDSEKKKKPPVSAAALAEIATEKTLKPEPRIITIDSIWQKLKGESTKPNNEEVASSGIDSSDILIPKPRTDESGVTEKVDSSPEAEGTIPDKLDELSPHEMTQAAQQFAEVRLQEADNELHELPLDSSAGAEAAANVALLRAMQEGLQTSADISVEDILDAAEKSVAADINRLSEESISDQSVTEHDPPVTIDADGRPQEAVADAGRGAGRPPDLPPPPDVFGAGSFGEGDSNRSTDEVPPILERYPSQTGIASQPNLAPDILKKPTPNVMPVVDALSGERAAMGQGLLAGGIVGYLMGKRRGRIRSEKQLLPLQHKLERQVKNLESQIADKELRIKQLAREKMQAVIHNSERKGFVDRLVPAAGASADRQQGERASGSETGADTRMPEAVLVAAAATLGNRIVEKPQVPEQAPPLIGLPSNEILIGQRFQRDFGPSHDVGRYLVEAPAAVGATAAASRTAKQEKIVPFDKKAENFTHDELMTTAEKIKVQGVTLKEMVELGRLDESSLRRVTQEFLEGGDVSAMVAHEIQEKEIKYERDPRLRQSLSGKGSSTDGSVIPTGGALSAHNAADVLQARGARTSLADSDGPRPIPDSAMLHEVRNKQIATAGGSAIILILIIMILVLLAR